MSEYSYVGLHYTYEIAQVSPYAGAPLEILLAAGSTYGSIFGYSYSYNTLDDARKPTKGFAISFSPGLCRLWRQSEIHQDRGQLRRLPVHVRRQCRCVR